MKTVQFVIIGASAVLFLSGCKSLQRGSSELTLDTCESITNMLRGFHQRSFPGSNWVCEAGVLRSLPGRGVDLITRGKYADFELTLEWKASRGANSGILYGVSESTTETYWSGAEMQVNDDANHPDGRTPNHSAGSLYDLIAPNDSKHLNPTGEYNLAKLVCKKGHVEHWLNGEKIVEYDWDSPSTRDIISKSKFKSAPKFMKRRKGHIAFQHHGDEVSFRNIRIRRL